MENNRYINLSDFLRTILFNVLECWWTCIYFKEIQIFHYNFEDFCCCNLLPKLNCIRSTLFESLYSYRNPISPRYSALSGFQRNWPWHLLDRMWNKDLHIAIEKTSQLYAITSWKRKASPKAVERQNMKSVWGCPGICCRVVYIHCRLLESTVE